jgi:hypothetical protein
VPVRLDVKQLKKIAKLAELEGVDRSTVLRKLIDIGLDSPQVSLLMRRPGTKGQSEVERVIRVVAAHERVKVTQSAVMRAPSVETEVNTLRAEEEQAEAMAAYDHHHPKTPDLCRLDRFDFLDGAADMQRYYAASITRDLRESLRLFRATSPKKARQLLLPIRAWSSRARPRSDRGRQHQRSDPPIRATVPVAV